ncbi:hypothetical protein VTP01DRAFT_5113 [Rhizomucor pusillus]|uniref:uncharacterized protein n=1 Tax=Rhizomucor pusillus TaxID=4840 RepID=UPI003742F162
MYERSRSDGANRYRRLYVSNVNKYVRERDLEDLFSRLGRVSNCIIRRRQGHEIRRKSLFVSDDIPINVFITLNSYAVTVAAPDTWLEIAQRNETEEDRQEIEDPRVALDVISAGRVLLQDESVVLVDRVLRVALPVAARGSQMMKGNANIERMKDILLCMVVN